MFYSILFRYYIFIYILYENMAKVDSTIQPPYFILLVCVFRCSSLLYLS